jgi:small subunit ribosomal protein S1
MSHELSIGKCVLARVIKIMPFGVFVELDGSVLVGLVKIPEISWQPIRHPADAVVLGQVIEAEIVAYDPATKQISLSMKRCQPAPE